MRRRLFLGAAGATGLAVAFGAGASDAAQRSGDRLHRADLWAAGPGGRRISVREVTAAGPASRRTPLLLVHGARPDGRAAFDLPVPGGSLAGDLARIGFAVYVMDISGFGRSDYPAGMSTAPQGPPLVRSDTAVADIGAAVSLIRRRSRSRRLAAFGWATGGHWLGMYAALHPAALTDLVVLNTLYGGTDPWPLQQELEDPDHPGRPRPQPAWRAVTAESLTARWDDGLAGTDDPDSRRDPAVRRAYTEAALSADPTSGTRNPPAFRNPTGPLLDAFYQAQGRQFYDASLIRARTLVLRGEADFWSRPGDSKLLMSHLTGAATARSATIPGASHYLHLERPAFGRDRLLAELTDFLG